MTRVTRLINIALFVAACAGAQTPDPERIEDLSTFHGADALLCWQTDGRWQSPGSCACPVGEVFDSVSGCEELPPPPPLCPNGVIDPGEECDGVELGGETCVSQGFDGGTLACAADCLSFDTSACTTDPPPPPAGGTLAEGLWVSVPGSEMRSIHDPAIDDQWQGIFGNADPFRSVQSAWSGATCNVAAEEMLVTGGGHGDGPHNGVFALDVSDVGLGEWRRVTLPTTEIWGHPNQPCPGGTCDPQVIDPRTGLPYEDCSTGKCPVEPDGQRVSRHTYASLTTDGTYLYSIGGSVRDGTSGDQPRSWKLHLDTGVWTPLADTNGARASGVSALVDGKIYYGSRSFTGRVYDTATDVWSGFALKEAVNHESVLLHVASMDRLFLVGDRSEAWSIPVSEWATGTPTTYPQTGVPASSDMGATYYPPEDLILVWGGGQDIHTLDPHTGTWSVVTPGGENPGAVVGASVYGRFSYCGGKLVLINGVDNPLFYIEVGQAEPPPPPEPEPEPGNFEARANGPGVVFVDPLDTSAPWWIDDHSAKQTFLNDDGTAGIPTHSWWRKARGVSSKGPVKPQLDASIMASGTGSLRFEYRAFSGAGDAGQFATNLSGDLSVGFGEGETFYVQYRIRHSCDAIYFDCDERSPTYKTQRRYFRTNTTGGWTAMKNIIIADGDPMLGESTDACTWMQIVVNHGRDHNLGGFHSCGWYAGFSEATGEKFGGSTQFDSQAGGYALDANGNKILGLADEVFPTCWRMPHAPASTKYSWGDTGPDCWQFRADEWATIQVRVEIGTWQPERDTPPNSRVTVWAAHEGEPQTRIIDRVLYLRGPNTRYNTSGDYGKIWLLPHMTSKDATEEHPTFFVWYDELIVSTEFIPDPA